MEKVEVNGPGTHPVYAFLKSSSHAADIKWTLSQQVGDMFSNCIHSQYSHKPYRIGPEPQNPIDAIVCQLIIITPIEIVSKSRVFRWSAHHLWRSPFGQPTVSRTQNESGSQPVSCFSLFRTYPRVENATCLFHCWWWNPAIFHSVPILYGEIPFPSSFGFGSQN